MVKSDQTKFVGLVLLIFYILQIFKSTISFKPFSLAHFIHFRNLTSQKFQSDLIRLKI